MSDQPSPFDAYQPPAMADEVPPTKDRSSGWLKAICIIAVVLGILGVLNALSSAAGLIFSQQIQSAFSPGLQPGIPQEMVDAQNQMQAELQAVQERFWAISAVLILVHVMIALALLVGGIQCLRRVPPGRRVLLAACGAAIPFEIVRAIVHAMIQLQSGAVTAKFMPRMMEAGDGSAPPQVAEFAMTVAKAGMVVGLVMGLFWVTLKIIFYVISVRHLRKAEVRSQLDAAPDGT
jgi:hypothetical protein